MAVLPGVALLELWSVMGIAEQALLAVSAFVVVAGLIGMLTTILSSLNERRREMAILRSVGARPGHVFGLLIAEAGALAIAGALAGIVIALHFVVNCQTCNHGPVWSLYCTGAAVNLRIVTGWFGHSIGFHYRPAACVESLPAIAFRWHDYQNLGR